MIGQIPNRDERTVYILLTRSETWFSKLIHLVTDDRYTHASIGLDGPGGPFYSFGRKYRRFALPAGLVVEEMRGCTLERRKEIPCCLYALNVPAPVYARLRRRLDGMYARREQYRYNLLGALACYFQWPLHRENCYFCSQFAASLLESCGAVRWEKEPALIRPADFCTFFPFRPIYQGTLGSMPAARLA